jgi:hypothetical protein
VILEIQNGTGRSQSREAKAIVAVLIMQAMEVLLIRYQNEKAIDGNSMVSRAIGL